MKCKNSDDDKLPNSASLDPCAFIPLHTNNYVVDKSKLLITWRTFTGISVYKQRYNKLKQKIRRK